ncbi:MAG: DegT/DnrJ/EryC1/StrS family aminotransferase [Armatimonadetes bacterium]|nr:DegT/DnrJ/EryC1/StrS family aminotransferase [Armatimonadota bacterium]
MASFFQRGAKAIRRRAFRLKQSVVRRMTPPPPPPLKVVVVGCGQIASTHMDGFQRTGLARVVAVSDIYLPALAKAAAQWREVRTFRDHRQMFRDIRPDIVSVCTWPQSHAEIIADAVAAEIPAILCEKPLALRMSEIDQIREAVDKKNLKFAVGHHYRFHPRYIRAAEIVKSGALGEIRSVTGHVVGSLFDNGPHLIDSVRFILGDPAIRRVACRCERSQGRFYQDIPAEDGASGEILFEGGLRCEFRTGDQSPGFFAIRVEGSQGWVEVGPSALEAGGPAQELAAQPLGPDCRTKQFGDFVRWVKGQQAGYPAVFEPSARAVELVLSCYESSRLGEPVNLPLMNRGEVIRDLFPDQAPARPSDGAFGPPPPAMMPGASPEPLAIDGGPRAAMEWFNNAACVGEEELKNLKRVIQSKYMNCTDGKETPALEREFAEAYGSHSAVASTSGTAAIHIALGALNLNPGDEVVTTPITDMGSIIPILACNCIPVFADVDPITGSITAESIARQITPRTKAVILVHLFGRPADLDPICALLEDKKIALIEDCCQAHFAEYKGRKVGTFGDFGCLSLQQSKQITCGDGGITLVNRPDLAERAALFADKGWDRAHGTRTHLFFGMNYRMTELQAAVARAQLAKLPGLLQGRRESAEHLRRLLRQIDGIETPDDPQGAVSSWWIFTFAIDEGRFGVGTEEFCNVLRVEGVPVRRQYLPSLVFEYPALKEQNTFGDSHFPFSAFPYTPPKGEDYPGFAEFQNRQVLIIWSNHARIAHAEAAAAAVRKVARYYEQLKTGTRPQSGTPVAQARQ